MALSAEFVTLKYGILLNLLKEEKKCLNVCSLFLQH